MSAGVVFQQMCIIFLLMMLGYWSSRKGILSDTAGKDVSALVVNICNPMLMLSSVLDSRADITGEKILTAVVVVFFMYAALILLAVLLPKLLRVPLKAQGHYGVMVLLGNVGFVGIPVIEAVLGSQYLIYVVIVCIYFNIIAYTYGQLLIDKGQEGHQGRFQPKRIINIGTIAGTASILLFVLRPELPQILTQTIHYTGRATTFLSLLMIGISLAHQPLKEIFTDTKMYVFVAVRFVVIPVVFGIVLRCFVQDTMLCLTLLLLTAMPVANLPLMMAEEEGIDGTVLSRGIVLSTVLSLVTIPLVIFILQ